jgi:tRNA threonylcarbamoyladenosine biosynthesis protein TsaB
MSALMLAVEASTYAASVALVKGDTVLHEMTVPMRDPKQERLMPAIASTLASTSARELDAIVCGGGPGSFTSLRIAAAIAKGLAVAGGKPLFAISSLLLIVAGMETPPAPGTWLMVLDAMRGESFVQLTEVTSAGAMRESSDVRVVRDDDIESIAQSAGARIAGPGRQVDCVPHARGVARLHDHAALAAPVDLATWEPNYGRLAEAQVRWEAAHGRALNARTS